MNKFLFFLLFIGSVCAAQNRPIITKWYGQDGSFTISAQGAFYYTYQKVGSTVVSGSFYSQGTLTMNIPGGDYIVSITPTSTFRFHPNSSNNNPRFLELIQWGDVSWNSDLSRMFMGCNNLKITATDIPNFSNVTQMNDMFSSCKIIDNIPNANSWDVSKVTRMDKMFYGATVFNQNISSWNVANVTNMIDMFNGAAAFNQNIGNWDVSKVTKMNQMFTGATAFNQNIGSWNVSKVTDMLNMFKGAETFNQNISNWDVSKVEYMGGIFNGSKSFNQSIADWNISKVTNMTSMFDGATAFNQDIGTWNVSNVITMKNMFNGAASFNQNIGNWDVSKVTNMERMFNAAAAFNQNIENWNVNRVTNMDYIFRDATSFNQNLGNWKLSGTSNSGNYLYSIFDNSGLSCHNYALTLKGWAENPSTPRNKNLGVANIKYGQVGQNYRHFFTTQKGWTFSGDIFEPTCNDALSTNENSLSEKLNFYPNPTTGRIFYQSQADEQVQISNTAGQLLKTVKVTKGTNQIDVSEFPKGVYFLKAGIKTSKLLKN